MSDAERLRMVFRYGFGLMLAGMLLAAFTAYNQPPPDPKPCCKENCPCRAAAPAPSQ